MQTITKIMFALGFVGAMAIGLVATPSPANAQGLYFSGPGVEVDVGGPQYRHRYYDDTYYRPRYHRHRYYDDYAYDRGYYGRSYRDY
jgi:hypothetical protein